MTGKTLTPPIKRKKTLMPTKAPMSGQDLFKAPDLTTKIQNVRPTSMRNLGPWKPGK